MDPELFDADHYINADDIAYQVSKFNGFDQNLTLTNVPYYLRSSYTLAILSLGNLTMNEDSNIHSARIGMYSKNLTV